jgi:hypothetical protein
MVEPLRRADAMKRKRNSTKQIVTAIKPDKFGFYATPELVNIADRCLRRLNQPSDPEDKTEILSLT